MKVYISSTYRDLRDYREATRRALARMGHDVIGMEQYVAGGGRPLERCRDDVRKSDVYVMILAWRYGYVPTPNDTNSESMTALEYRAALAEKKPVLAFLLDPEAPWPPSDMDAMSAEARRPLGIDLLRAEVGQRHLAGIFRSPEDLASQVAAAVAAQGATTGLIDRLIKETSTITAQMGNFGHGGTVNDSNLSAIKKMVVDVGESRALFIRLGRGDDWWSTRLYLLAGLVGQLTLVRQIVFERDDGSFAGMASPGAVVDGLASNFSHLTDFGLRVTANASTDRETEIERQFDVWRALLLESANQSKETKGSKKAKAEESKVEEPPERRGEITGLALEREREIKVGVRAELLAQWLGDRLFARCIKVAVDGPSMTQIQQVVEFLVPDVPIQRAKRGGTENDDIDEGPMIQVVDRDAFALELARQWVQTGLPRTPIL